MTSSTAPSLFDRLDRIRDAAVSARESDRHGRFLEWVHHNSAVVRKVIHTSRELKRQGHEHYSMDGVFHIIRWEHAKTTRRFPGRLHDPPIHRRGRDPFLLNNNWTSYLARMVMDLAPDLDGFFITRKTARERE